MGAFYMAIGQLTLPWRTAACEKLHINRESFGFKMLQRFIVFMLMAAIVVPFSIGGLKATAVYFRQMFSVWNPWVLFDGSFYELGMTAADWRICIFGGLILLAVSVLREHGYSCKFIFQQNVAFRAALCLVMFFALIVFGVYGAQYSANAFVYAGF